jgi:hypothetical protein
MIQLPSSRVLIEVWTWVFGLFWVEGYAQATQEPAGAPLTLQIIFVLFDITNARVSWAR